MTPMPRSFMVEVSTELLANLLAEWSEPVQIMVTEDGGERGGYALVARRCDHVEAVRLLREAERLLGMSSMHDDEKAALILTIGEWLASRDPTLAPAGANEEGA